VFVESRNLAICEAPVMVYGNKPTDGGHLFFDSDEYMDFISKEPYALT